MKTRIWLLGWTAIVGAALLSIGAWIYRVDPYFHYHKPHTDEYYYHLDNQRSQNVGICKYFDYDALITGTSLTENFKTSELDEIFGVTSIKVPFQGGTYKEINDTIAKAKKYNPDLKMVVRGLDVGMFFDSPDRMRVDLGKYPTYLYDEDPFNDVNYLFNIDVLRIVYSMTKEKMADGFVPGYTPFDTYSSWQEGYTFGIGEVLSEGITYRGAGAPVHLSEAEKSVIHAQITQNVTALADEYPETDFYYFFTPYSVAYYKDLVENGTIYRQLEAEQAVIELILEHENIKLFSFGGIAELITDINNYKDLTHYGTWINSFILRCMQENKYLLTEDNYLEYLDGERELLVDFDYNSLNSQPDWPNDFYPAALLNEFTWKVKPIDVLNDCRDSMELAHAEPVSGQYEGSEGLKCTGSPQAGSADDEAAAGARIRIEDIGGHDYLAFYGKKLTYGAQPAVSVLKGDDRVIAQISAEPGGADGEWQQYLIDLSAVTGDITVCFGSGGSDNGESEGTEYMYSGIMLY